MCELHEQSISGQVQLMTGPGLDDCLFEEHKAEGKLVMSVQIVEQDNVSEDREHLTCYARAMPIMPLIRKRL